MAQKEIDMNEQQIVNHIADKLAIKPGQVRATLALFDQANTIPFIARYRKEATGELDEVQIRQIKVEFEYLTALNQRKETVRQTIEEQGLWTDELAKRLDAAVQLQEVEDIYLPFRPKKRTKAAIAMEAGLEALAHFILDQNGKTSPEDAATAYLSDAVPTVADAVTGACNIIAEKLSEQASFRQYLRKQLWKNAKLTCSLAVEEADAGAMLTYKEFSEFIRHIPSHRILAINRGEAQKILKVTLAADHDTYIAHLAGTVTKPGFPFADLLADTASDSYKRLIFPQLEREIRNDLTERAEKQAIDVFSENLRHLLLQPPLSGHTILGLDPGYRTGCKAAIINAYGDVLDYGTFHLTSSQKQRDESAATLTRLIKKHKVTLISIGNGTASYETEQFTARLIQENRLPCHYIIANEAGASVYSASDLAREELPDLDVSIRGAVSIARRIQDPLAESVKIDPRSIGVGQYQHDVNQKQLSAALDDVVESVVNYVGVDLNTASAALLQHISGISASVARNIVACRNENGPFHNRRELLKVNRLGPASFTQCAGFLRIKKGDMPLDNTSVHPESYDLAKAIVKEYGFTLKDLKNEKKLQLLQSKLQMNAAAKLAAKLDAGLPTIRDILEELRKPGRDVRDDLPKPLTRKNVLSLDELKVGTIVRGTVHNVVDFGAFVDFGLKTPGLIHRSELCTHSFRHPLDVIHVGDIIDAVIISVDATRGRIGLSIKQLEQKK
jgi:uncharacterized protein